jgi:hypothetical protein
VETESCRLPSSAVLFDPGCSLRLQRW